MRAEASRIHLWAHNSSEQQQSIGVSLIAGSRKMLHKPTQNEETLEKAAAIKMAPEYQSSLRMAKMSKNG